MSTTKIALTITTCNECPAACAAKSTGESRHFLICTHKEDQMFLLWDGIDKPDHYKIEIPKECPLEDYKSKP